MNDTNTKRPRPRRMIVADDDPAVLRLVADRCAALGFQVETAMNGMQLLVKARHNHPDIVIADVNMPALDGLSVCARLLDPDRRPLEVVVITGADDQETAERCESLGTFFGRKGPNFWDEVQEALIEIYPDLADRCDALAATPNGAVPQRPRVLVVDGDPDSGNFLASRLAKYGVDALYAADARQACRIAAREKPSIIVTDSVMPDGSAESLLQRLRAAPATATIPVCVVSTQRLSELDEHNLRRDIAGRPGAAQILRKSFDTEELFATLRQYCSFRKPAPPRSCLETVGW